MHETIKQSSTLSHDFLDAFVVEGRYFVGMAAEYWKRECFKVD